MRERWIVVLLGVLGLGCAVSAEGALTAHRDIAYATICGVNENQTSLDIYGPAPVPEKHVPVVIWVHGGGWARGDKANQMQAKPALFTTAGYCLVSVNYRLSGAGGSEERGQAKYAGQAQDVAAAVAWVHAHIAEYGGDPARIALMGHSAGAHLVSLVSTDESFLKAQGLALDRIKASVSLDTEGYDIPSHMKHATEGIYENAFGTDPTVWKQASPLYHVSPGKSIPSFLAVTRGMPERRRLAEDFVAALKGVGVRAVLVNAAGYSHAEVNSRIGAAGESTVTPPVMQFLAEHLPPKGRADPAP